LTDFIAAKTSHDGLHSSTLSEFVEHSFLCVRPAATSDLPHDLIAFLSVKNDCGVNLRIVLDKL